MNKSILLGACLAGIFFLFATYEGITATPKFWHDEAVPFEIARNLAEHGKFDIAIAPGVFWEKSYMTHATGFPLTAPLAAFFKIFGVGVLQSRIFMIAWMLGTLVALFFVMRASFDKQTALFSVLLVATFSSFYGNGRTGTGEIPGFLFLLFSLYFLYKKEWYGWGGFFAALAAVTKPSMYLMVLPVIVLEFIARNRASIFTFLARPSEAGSGFRASLSPPQLRGRTMPAPRSKPVKTLALFLCGISPILLFWLWLVNPAPFNLQSWQEMITFYQNAFNAPSLLSQFPAIIPDLLTHSTIIYFILLLVPILIAWRKKLFSYAQNRLAIFFFLYGALSFFYFLRSPGWLRYLLGMELLILALLPAALFAYTETKLLSRTWRSACNALLLAMALFQSIQYLWLSEIPSGTQSIITAKYLNNLLTENPSATIGIIDNAPVAALIPADRKIQRIRVGNDRVVGIHPLSLPSDQMPTYLINIKENDPYQDVLKTVYKTSVSGPSKIQIYQKKPLQ